MAKEEQAKDTKESPEKEIQESSPKPSDPEEEAPGSLGTSSFSNLLTPSEIESLRQDPKDGLAYAQGKSRHLKKE
jgi:hypothetical protein